MSTILVLYFSWMHLRYKHLFIFHLWDLCPVKTHIFAVRITLWQCFHPLRPAMERSGVPHTPLNAVNAAQGLLVPGVTQPPITPTQSNNCAQRKLPKTSKRNLLGDERENYDDNQLCKEKRKAVSLWENFQHLRKGEKVGREHNKVSHVQLIVHI